MLSTIFCTFLALVLSHSWMEVHPFLSDIENKFKYLQGYTADLMSYSGGRKLFVFGGYTPDANSSSLYWNDLFEADLATLDGTVYISGSAKPEPRYAHCSVIHKFQLFIFGGINSNGQILKDLWKFDSFFHVWISLNINGPQISQCSLTISQNSLFASGKNSLNNLQIKKYSMTTNLWTNIAYQYYFATQEEALLWDNTKSSVTVVLENQSSTSSEIIKLTSIAIEYICTFVYQSSLYIVTQSNVYKMNLSTYKIYHYKTLQKGSNKFYCEKFEDWLFIIRENADSGDLLLRYHSLTDIHKEGVHAKTSPIVSGSYFQMILVEGNLWLFSNFTAWILNQTCQVTKNVLACFFEEMLCAPTQSVYNCEVPRCPNSLLLFDNSSFGFIRFQCSNHGVCEEGGCKCDQFWGGDDCSIYMRKECYGNLLQNWPVMNCECKEETSGGNNCEVTFCYNDCSQHGECKSNGQCLCADGYYGADCSIIIIAFPGASYTI